MRSFRWHEPSVDVPEREVIRVTDDTTKAELEEAMTNMAATAARMPAHWVERKAATHRRIDALLGEWERAPA